MLESFDPEVHQILRREEAGEGAPLDLRPERNYVSAAVQEALASPLAELVYEGHPDRRLARASEALEEIERIGNERLAALFGCEGATLQPAGPAQAAAAALEGLASPGETILAPKAGRGAALVYGHASTIWGGRFRFAAYGPDPSGEIFDFDSLEKLAVQCAPSLVVVSIPPYPRRQDFAAWRRLADRVRARLLVDLGCAAGLVPGGVIPSPAPFADVIVGATHGLFRGPPGGFIAFRATWKERVLDALFPRLMCSAPAASVAAKVVAAKEAASPAFAPYVRECVERAQGLCRALSERGLALWTKGTDFHYAALDLRPLQLNGIEAEERLAETGIFATRISLDFVKGCTFKGEGLLLGTQAAVLRRDGEGAADRIAQRIARALGA